MSIAPLVRCRPHTLAWIVGLAMGTFLTAPSPGQPTAPEPPFPVDTLRRMVNARLKGVSAYTVETTAYTARYRVIAHAGSLRVPRRVEPPGPADPLERMALTPLLHLPVLARALQSADYAGIEQVGGVRCHIFAPRPPSSLAAYPNAEVAGVEVAVSVDRLYPRRVTVALQAESDAGMTRITVDLSDYREDLGPLVPYRWTITRHRIPQGTPDERRRATQLRRQMEHMDPEQRKMLRSMLGDRLRRLITTSSADRRVITVERLEVKRQN